MSDERAYIVEAIEAAKGKLPDGHELIVISVPTGEPNPRVRYSSSLDRETSIMILKHLLFRWGKDEAWMKHV